ncbi:hypothetical protein Droror1_Dr00006827 [Drosera rotundifolia]
MTATDSDEANKLAIAMALLRSKLFQQPPPQQLPPPRRPRTSSPSHPLIADAQRWKRKAKDRKLEILRLKQDLKDLEDGSHCDLYPQSAFCKCYFFSDMGELSPRQVGSSSSQGINDVLRRRFLRQVRLNESRKRRATDSVQKRIFSEHESDDKIEQLRMAGDFLMDICNKDCLVEGTIAANLAHQAVEFISSSLKNLLSIEKGSEVIEATVSNLIVRLIRRMTVPLQEGQSNSDSDMQLQVQHLIRKLGSSSFLGQRVLFAICHRISELAENMLFMDPFEGSFPIIHDSMFVMIQLIEFLVADHLLTWSKDEAFDSRLFEKWMKSVAHARKALELLESRGSLYSLYMDRVIGELTRQLGQSPNLQKQHPHILDCLFC